MFEWFMVYLHLILASSKGQSQGHASIDCEYLVNGGRYDTHCYYQFIGSDLFIFDGCIYIWPWPIVKVKVKVKV